MTTRTLVGQLFGAPAGEARARRRGSGLAGLRRARTPLLLQLPSGTAWSAAVGGRGVAVAVESGTVWITREGDPCDHVVESPSVFASDRRGRLGVQALTSARVRIAPR
jgi:hypothetical protein